MIIKIKIFWDNQTMSNSIFYLSSALLKLEDILLSNDDCL
jgi:hypothetical protein